MAAAAVFGIVWCVHLARAFAQPADRPPARRRPRPPIRPAVAAAVEARIPTEASRQGVRAVVLFPAKARYKDGAPVVVNVTPAVQPGRPGRGDRCGLTALGFVVVNAAYPAGEDFDQGGPRCKRALADVLLFAMGRKADDRGRRIGQMARGKVLTDVVGAVGWSHGGNAVVTTLQAHGAELKHLAYYVSYESPCGTSKAALGDIINVDYGGVRFDPDPRRDADGDGLGWDDGRNPFYTPDKPLDFSKLRWDADVTWRWRLRPSRGMLFLDGNGNGKFDVVEAGRPGPGRGGLAGTPDTNRNGRLDRTEDFPFSFLSGTPRGRARRFYSLSVTRAAAKSVFRDGFPDGIADVAEAKAYWSERDMAAGFERLGPNAAGLLVCIYAGRQDHVQAQPDCPHIRAQYNGLRAAGVKWVKINPDPVYARALLGPVKHKLPANKPNQPVDAAAVWRMTAPARMGLGHVFVAAAACELADRVKAGRTDPILSAVLFPDAPKAAATVPPYFWAPERFKAP